MDADTGKLGPEEVSSFHERADRGKPLCLRVPEDVGVGTADAAGAYSANPATEDLGVGTTPASRLGYLGGAERFTVDAALRLIGMGIRLDDPNLGRLLQTDPIPGGSANNYDYANQDPDNGLDLGGDRSFYCSDDFCGAAQAKVQGDIDSALTRSSTWYEQNQSKNNKIRNAPIYGPTSYWGAVAETIQVLGIGAGIAFSGGALSGAESVDLALVGRIDTGSTIAGAIATCINNGPITIKCGGAAATATISTFAGTLATAAVRRGARPAAVAWAGISGGVSYLSQLAGL